MSFAGTSAGTFPHHFHNFLPHSRLEVEPVVGLEPTTDGLQNRCSTTELNWLEEADGLAGRMGSAQQEVVAPVLGNVDAARTIATAHAGGTLIVELIV